MNGKRQNATAPEPTPSLPNVSRLLFGILPVGAQHAVPAAAQPKSRRRPRPRPVERRHFLIANPRLEMHVNSRKQILAPTPNSEFSKVFLLPFAVCGDGFATLPIRITN